jgi:twitching motility protein PilT
MTGHGELPSREQLGLPAELISVLSDSRGGLVLITGAPRSGLSTTLNWMLDFLNMTRRTHLMIFQECAGIAHYHKLSMVSQRRKGSDYQDLCSALRETPRQGATVVMIEERLDRQALLLAAELGYNGHTVLAGTSGHDVVESLESMYQSMGPSHWQDFAAGLGAVVHQRLLPGRSGGRVPVLEILRRTAGVANRLREGKLEALKGCMETGHREGMQTLDQALCQAVQAGLLSPEEALRHARDPRLLGHSSG